MRHFLLSISTILLLFSCSQHLTVSQINTRNIAVNTQTATIDSLALFIVKPYRDSIQNDMSKLVAVSATALVKDKPESKLTNLVSDVILEYAANYCIKNSLNVKPDAAYVNYGGIRASLPQGEITVGRIFEVMPFENEIVLVKVSGESILKMVERIAARGGEGVAGLRLGIRNGKPGTLMVGGKAVDPSAMYWLATNDYIADGGDQMSMLLNPTERINTKLKIRDVLIQAMSERYKRNGIIEVQEDGRIYNEQ
jgi:2',3'-cyclic-nucleotide 2'-phosphodiesterase (5'-nucleotidase family)